MRIFNITSVAFTGYIELHFNDNDLLAKMENHAELSEKQQIFLLKNLPRDISELTVFKNTNAVVTEIKTEITFDMFWLRYDDKLNSSKKRAEQKWNKMTPTDQYKAFVFILKYFSNVPQGTRKKYAETYLNAELWNN